MRKKIIIVIAWGLLAAALATVYIGAVEGKFSRENFYNADALYIPALYRDLASGHNLVGWNPPAVPYFFPDVPIYFLVNSLVGNLHLAIVLFGVIQFFALIIGLILISNHVFAPNRSIHFLILVAGIVTGLLFATGKFSIPMPMFISGFHFGAMLSSIFSLFLIVRLLRIKPNTPVGAIANYGLLFLVALLTIASDAIYLVQFLVPALFGFWLLLLTEKISLKQLSLFFIAMIPAAPLGYWLNRALLIYRPVRPAAKITLGVYAKNFALARQKLFSGWTQGDWFPKEWLPVFTIIWLSFILLTLAVVIRLLCRSLHRHSETRCLRRRGLWITIFTVGLLGTIIPILTFKHGWIFWGIYFLTSIYFLAISRKHDIQSPATDSSLFYLFSYLLLMVIATVGSLFVSGGFYSRYFLPALLFPLFFGWPFLLADSKPCMKILDQNKIQIGIILILIFLLFWIGDLSQLSHLSKLSDYYPDDVRCLDDYAERNYIHNGIAPYWRAKPITILSKKKMLIVQAKPDHSIDHWVNNLSDYNNRFDFIIADGFFDLQKILAEFGNPANIITCKDFKVLVYNRVEDAAFQQQFQRLFDFSFDAAQLPSETGRIIGSSRIADAASGANGCLAKSPDLNLWIGDYRFEIVYFAKFNEECPIGSWKIVLNSTKNRGIILKKGKFKPSVGGVISGVFSIRQSGQTTVQTFYQGKGILRIDAIRIRLKK